LEPNVWLALCVQIPLDHALGTSKGFGFVEFQDEKDCAEA
jgi:RNA recognition motif-containing protein